MKKLSNKIRNRVLAGVGVFLAVLTYCGYRMYSVVYGPRPVECLYGPRPFEIIDEDSLINDTLNNQERNSAESLIIESSTN